MINKTVGKIILLDLVIISIMGLVLAGSWSSLPPQLPWFYSLPNGEQQLVDKNVLVLVLLGMVAAVIVTWRLSTWSAKEDSLVQVTIMVGGLIGELLLAASFFRVMQIFLL